LGAKICLKEMKEYFKTEMGYIHYENPPADTYNEFVEIVNKLVPNNVTNRFKKR